jgi:signal transduction histidine kinase
MDEKINILLVDDQPAKLLTYKSILNDLGENLITADSGMQALEKLLKHDIAVVLMDVSMPGMDGFETAQMIHRHPRFENTPIVFISGIHITEGDFLKGYQFGAVDYVPVPISAELLRGKVRVFAELHRKTRKLELLNERMTLVQEEERRRIARELHDSIGQLLVAIEMNHAALLSESQNLSPGAASSLAENVSLTEEVSKQVRTISYLLHPPLLDEAGLASALVCYVEGFSKRSKIDVKLQIAPDLGRFPSDTEISIFRLIQECLTNIHRHSGSLMAMIHIRRTQTSVSVEVEDAGKGISLQSLSSIGSGVGLPGMRERLRRLGGNLQIHSNELGTKLTAVIPVAQNDSSIHYPVATDREPDVETQRR